MLPYLGPGIIAVMQAAHSPSLNNSESGLRIPLPDKNEDKIIPSMVFSLSLSCSDEKILLMREVPLVVSPSTIRRLHRGNSLVSELGFLDWIFRNSSKPDV